MADVSSAPGAGDGDGDEDEEEDEEEEGEEGGDAGGAGRSIGSMKYVYLMYTICNRISKANHS